MNPTSTPVSSPNNMLWKAHGTPVKSAELAGRALEHHHGEEGLTGNAWKQSAVEARARKTPDS